MTIPTLLQADEFLSQVKAVSSARARYDKAMLVPVAELNSVPLAVAMRLTVDIKAVIAAVGRRDHAKAAALSAMLDEDRIAVLRRRHAEITSPGTGAAAGARKGLNDAAADLVGFVSSQTLPADEGERVVIWRYLEATVGDTAPGEAYLRKGIISFRLSQLDDAPGPDDLTNLSRVSGYLSAACLEDFEAGVAVASELVGVVVKTASKLSDRKRAAEALAGLTKIVTEASPGVAVNVDAALTSFSTSTSSARYANLVDDLVEKLSSPAAKGLASFFKAAKILQQTYKLTAATTESERLSHAIGLASAAFDLVADHMIARAQLHEELLKLELGPGKAGVGVLSGALRSAKSGVDIVGVVRDFDEFVDHGTSGQNDAALAFDLLKVGIGVAGVAVAAVGGVALWVPLALMVAAGGAGVAGALSESSSLEIAIERSVIGKKPEPLGSSAEPWEPAYHLWRKNRDGVHVPNLSAQNSLFLKEMKFGTLHRLKLSTTRAGNVLTVVARLPSGMDPASAWWLRIYGPAGLSTTVSFGLSMEKQVPSLGSGYMTDSAKYFDHSNTTYVFNPEVPAPFIPATFVAKVALQEQFLEAHEADEWEAISLEVMPNRLIPGRYVVAQLNADMGSEAEW